MKHRKMWTTALTLVLALTCLSFKCGGGGQVAGGNTDAKRKYAKAADDIAGALNSMVDVLKNLQQQGRISADEGRKAFASSQPTTRSRRAWPRAAAAVYENRRALV